jgi:hypothetical protein
MLVKVKKRKATMSINLNQSLV